MKKPIFSRFSRIPTLAGLSVAAVALMMSQVVPVTAQSAAPPVPGGSPANDQLAWANFVRAVTPSKAAPGKVAYETWASDQDIYVTNPCNPVTPIQPCNRPAWPTARKAKVLESTTIGHDQSTRIALAAGTGTVQAIGPSQGCGKPGGLGAGNAAANSGFPANGCVGEEVRRDRASYDYIVNNGLWSKSGLINSINGGAPVAFPTNALNVKADWIPVKTLAAWLGKPESFVKARFYTALGSLGEGTPATVLMAMTSMHVSIKAPGYPNWVWANFENAYTPGRCDLTGCVDNFGATKPFVAPNQQNWGQYGACDKSPAAIAMLRNAKVPPIFANYCLTGTQVDYGTSANPTLLGSPIIEPLNADVLMNRSSCISCHAAAAFQVANNGKINLPFSVLGSAPIGPQNTPAGFKSYDFMWGVLKAN